MSGFGSGFGSTLGSGAGSGFGGGGGGFGSTRGGGGGLDPRLLDRRELAPQLRHHRVGLLRLPADAEEEHREERDVHRDGEEPREARARVALLERSHQGWAAGFTISPTRFTSLRCSSSITLSTAS